MLLAGGGVESASLTMPSAVTERQPTRRMSRDTSACRRSRSEAVISTRHASQHYLFARVDDLRPSASASVRSTPR